MTQPLKNNAEKQNYDEGYERIFGEKEAIRTPSRDRYYTFPFMDGSTKTMTLEEAFLNGDHLVKKRFAEILNNIKNRHRKKDGFTSGWQENIQENIGGRKEYDIRLKELGLVEIGNDYIPQQSTNETHPCSNDEFIKEAAECGVNMTEGLEDSIKSGEFFKEEV